MKRFYLLLLILLGIGCNSKTQKNPPEDLSKNEEQPLPAPEKEPSDPVALLQEKWQKFHEQNHNNPEAKILQFCHRDGALTLKNALAFAPRELCERVVVVAIAPDPIIPERFCFEVHNYANELAIISEMDMLRCYSIEQEEEPFDLPFHFKMIFPPLSAQEVDTDFQSPTFANKIANHLESYEATGGYH